MPHHSESFWTSLFALFVLHLAERGAALNVWHCKEPTDGRYYEPRHSSGAIVLAGLRATDVSVEPPTGAMKSVVQGLLNEEVNAAGIRPDLFIRVPLAAPSGEWKYLFIENKTTGGFQPNQEENYPALLESFEKNGKPCEFLLLTSVGSCKPYESAKRFQRTMREAFGLLLWEEVLLQMKAHELKLPGIDTGAWQPFTRDFENVVVGRKTMTAN
ncbi:MAG TPA: hypothetical protein VGT03_04200 [Candidatus Acidoferrales bacterium]|nr:hypothetical protein [Candidatus Acidoferrales bacterium]